MFAERQVNPSLRPVLRTLFRKAAGSLAALQTERSSGRTCCSANKVREQDKIDKFRFFFLFIFRRIFIFLSNDIIFNLFLFG
jgi:hypothetical protein